MVTELCAKYLHYSVVLHKEPLYTVYRGGSRKKERGVLKVSSALSAKILG